MSKAAPGQNLPDGMRFRAESRGWARFIGAPDEAGNIPIAGAEDPALGKSFRRIARSRDRTRRAFQRSRIPERSGRAMRSRMPMAGSPCHRRRICCSTALAGVLLVLVYNQSPDLEYYTYHDLQPEPAADAGSGDAGEGKAQSTAADRRADAGRYEAAHRRCDCQGDRGLAEERDRQDAAQGARGSTHDSLMHAKSPSSSSRWAAASIRPRCSSTRSRAGRMRGSAHASTEERPKDRNACCCWATKSTSTARRASSIRRRNSIVTYGPTNCCTGWTRRATCCGGCPPS